MGTWLKSARKSKSRPEIVKLGHDGSAKPLPTQTSPQVGCGEEERGLSRHGGVVSQSSVCLKHRTHPRPRSPSPGEA